MDTPIFHVGQPVKIIETFNGRSRIVCKGIVDRITKSQIIIYNEHNNHVKFRTKDAKQVGYSWPHLCHSVLPDEGEVK
jgi:hypothetical protein